MRSTRRASESAPVLKLLRPPVTHATARQTHNSRLKPYFLCGITVVQHDGGTRVYRRAARYLPWWGARSGLVPGARLSCHAKYRTLWV